MRAGPFRRCSPGWWRFLGLVLLTACSSWRVQPVAPVQLITAEQPAQVRVQRADGQQLVLKRRLIRGDTIWGQTTADSAGVPLTEISAIAVRRPDWLKTTGLVVLTTGAAFGVACAVGCDFGPDFSFDP